MTELLSSGEVDALIVVLVATRVGQPGPLVQALAEARCTAPEIPVLLVSIGASQPLASAPDVTVLPSVAAAVGALARTCTYAAWRSEHRGAPGEPDDGSLLAGEDSESGAPRRLRVPR